jgi:beta-xylosidase
LKQRKRVRWMNCQLKNKNSIRMLLLFAVVFPALSSFAQQTVSAVWVADNGDGTYKNPILHADYSDPDVVRVDEDYYMTASSFNCVPGLPILHSKDLVNWELIGHAVKNLIPEEVFAKPQHGKGIWAPCIRYHNKEFYIYFPDPDFGIYLTKASDPGGPWTEPLLVKSGQGLIDPSPLWDDDGKAYLTFAFAGSRVGVKSVLLVAEMNPEGSSLIGDAVMVFDGHGSQPTVEGPKFYKRNGYYYIFAPAGGVTNGWQLVLRSRNVFGPYEEKIVLEQGSTSINGPHQGAWVETAASGEHWFIHFQDMEAYGRVVHLQPMQWENDWPIIGIDQDGNNIGEPLSSFKKPDVGKEFPISTPPDSDEFNSYKIGKQWQWNANPEITYGFPSGNQGFFRLNCYPRSDESKGLWDVPNMLLQKFPAEEFSASTKLEFSAFADNEEAGFVVMGEDYQYISLKRMQGKVFLRVVRCTDARKGTNETELFIKELDQNEIFFRIRVSEGAICTFSYSTDGKRFLEVGKSFTARPGRWIGARLGYFALRDGRTNDSGFADIDWIRIEK